MRHISRAATMFLASIGAALSSSQRFTAATLKDAFSFVNNRTNGFEHVLARRRGRNYFSGGGNTLFSPKQRHGAQERLRRQRQMARRNGALQGTHIHTGETALLRITEGSSLVLVQMDKFDHPHSHGWHDYPAKLWAVQQ